MGEHLQSGDQTMAPEDSAWQVTPHFSEVGCTYTAETLQYVQVTTKRPYMAGLYKMRNITLHPQ